MCMLRVEFNVLWGTRHKFPNRYGLISWGGGIALEQFYTRRTQHTTHNTTKTRHFFN